MYYQNYEDYMRSVLGYPMENRNTFGMETFGEQFNNNMTYRDTRELEECYPEIYRIINPIVCEVCDRHSNATTREEVERMVEEVYQKVIVNSEIAINIDNRSSEKEEKRTDNVKTNSNNRTINNEPARQTREVENRQRRPNNNDFLRDLIQILILNRLLGGGFFPGRPPRPRPPFPGQGRAPFPGGPGGMMPRPPMQRDYDNYMKF